jgi:hypothetical protein
VVQEGCEDLGARFRRYDHLPITVVGDCEAIFSGVLPEESHEFWIPIVAILSKGRDASEVNLVDADIFN